MAHTLKLVRPNNYVAKVSVYPCLPTGLAYSTSKIGPPSPSSPRRIAADHYHKAIGLDIGDEEIERVIEETEGFSGRAISKLAIAWHASTCGTDGAIPDQDTFFKYMSQKDDWITTERADMLTTDR